METFTLVLTGQELNIVFKSLQELPFREVAPIIDNIRMQVNAAQEERMKAEEKGDEE